MPDHETYINAQLQQADLIEYFDAGQAVHDDLKWIKKTLYWLCPRFSYTLRDINQLITRFRLIIKAIPTSKRLNPEVLCVMLFLRD